MSDTILLTGGTGHIGTALIPRLLDEPDTVVLALTRARDEGHLAHRREALLAKLPGIDATRLEVVAGDVAAEGLGLSARNRGQVLERATSVIHSAASVRFDLPQDTAARQNLEATERVLDLCRELGPRLQRYDHVSTCYVAGTRTGVVYEHEGDEGQDFRNSYEWSKCQAEGKVRAAMAEGLPAAIHRPAIVVGDSGSGATDSFNVIYWPLKLYVRGWWRTFPGRPEATVDIVPVDFVAGAMARIHAEPDTLGGCYHLAAGRDAPTVQQLVDRVRETTQGPPLRYVDQARYRRFVRPLLLPFFLTKRGRMVRRGGDAFMPYFEHNPVFDTTRAQAALGDLRPPPVLDYLDRIVRYAMARDFGEA